ADHSYIFDSLAADDAALDSTATISKLAIPASPIDATSGGTLSTSFDKLMKDIQLLAPSSQSATPAPFHSPEALRTQDALPGKTKIPQSLASGAGKYEGYCCTSITLFLLESHSDKEYIGLSGLQVLDPSLGIVASNIRRIFADPSKDMQAISSLHGGTDSFSMNKLLVKNALQVTQSQSSWLVPFTYSPALFKSKQYVSTKAALSHYKRDYQYVSIEFQSAQAVAGLRVWNYNTSGGTARGVKIMLVYLENQGESCGFLLPVRIANGHSFIPYHQTLMFQNFLSPSLRAQSYEAHNMHAYHSNDKLSYYTPKLRQSYEHNNYIVGMQLSIKLHSNHGDLYYVGLDKLDVILEDNTIVDLQLLQNAYQGMIIAYPHSINVLQTTNNGSSKDLRCAEQLLAAGGCGYLAPLVNRMSDVERANSAVVYGDPTLQSSHSVTAASTSFPQDNVVLISFSRPVAIAAIR
ncbi:DUF4457 domain-containing protein, partial [archaeon]